MTDVTTLELSEFTCPECDRTTNNPHDVQTRYCQWCHWWTGDPVMAGVQRDASFDEGRVTCLQPPTPGNRVVRGVARVTSPVVARCAVPSF
jgi:hypothetical protein